MEILRVQAPQEVPLKEVDAGTRPAKNILKEQRSEKVDLDHETERRFSSWGMLSNGAGHSETRST